MSERSKGQQDAAEFRCLASRNGMCLSMLEGWTRCRAGDCDYDPEDHPEPGEAAS